MSTGFEMKLKFICTDATDFEDHWHLDVFLAPMQRCCRNDQVDLCFNMSTIEAIVKRFYAVCGLASLLVAGLLWAGRAEAQDACTSYRIDFEGKWSRDSSPVTANGKPIGKVRPAQGEGPQSRQLTVCIEQKYANIFDKNTFAYVTDESIAIYSLWPSPTKLKENESIKGFTSLVGALTHAAETIPRIVEERVREWVSKILEAALGTKIDTGASPPQTV